MYEKDIEVVKKAIHTKLWRKDKDQFKKWDNLLADLSELHGIKKPEFILGETDIPCYSPMEAKIRLTKFSVISFLHEFGHHIRLTEMGCKEYSELVFTKAHPKAKLIRDERGYLMNEDKLNFLINCYKEEQREKDL